MKTLMSKAEEIIKKLIKKGEMNTLDNSIADEIFDKVEQDMEDYRIIDNYRKGISLIETNKILIYKNSN